MDSLKDILISMRDCSTEQKYDDLTDVINNSYNEQRISIDTFSLRRILSFIDEQIQSILISIFERDMCGDYPVELYDPFMNFVLIFSSIL